ncbi:MAG: 2-amino-4-hydroxy-6-hydroxymethyldihydropteridine diphosphokinase [Candidatus Scalindua rubra]|uniref:2-amino-4-hydroxy-6-hydroxymethyldihydropteridine pyrophosphokinase n=1 Tax=Candidatus Scalindua brodae TaxID=237368 RepID=A0A0B0EJH3_9BACT|nr:MAG: 2-amino-4-hydroxy-6-hydroxymethyldihydropteridine [Candidatus Scalindua brodae]MBZ0110116.1 2-amino-4-hydroxy-6-hydroxymethyldihydropteridine diphosphokinase [Candidatus Scalindua rubra]TWU36990.1 2-amino-4-hydroxy-6-hydroxymethyldihydropteridine pyrophosphokinase [Candidatus Brocadiaceae bacterium S225]
MTKVYAGLGSNLGNKIENIIRAIDRIDAHEEICVKEKSGFYNTTPVGGPSQPDYVNCVIGLETEIEPQTLLKEFKEIEIELGRKPGVRWGPRVVDIDILLYGDRIVNDSNLKIPHERMHERVFVLEPLYEISPDIKHPVSGISISELLEKLK